MFWLATGLAAIAVTLLAFRPQLGIPAVFIARPFVDTAWNETLGPLKLTEIFSVAVPLVMLLHMAMAPASAAFRRMPLRWIWTLWVLDVALFSGMILYNNQVLDGFNIFFRHLNGFVGFYMLQAYCIDDKHTKRALLAIAFAGVFPMATGLYEGLTGDHWKVTFGEGGLIRNIGMYHDGITMRYLALQTILATALVTTLYYKRRWIANVVATAYGAICAFVIYGVYSKAGTLTLASWLLFWPTMLRQVKTLAVFGVLGVLVAGYYSEQIVETASTVFTKEIGVATGELGVERSFSGRWYTWAEMMEHWSQFSSTQQIFGSGQIALGAHNNYLIVLYHGGLFGLSLYVMLLLTIGFRIVRDLMGGLDAWSVAALCAFVMWLVDTIGLVPSAYSGYQWFVWGIIGLAFRKRVEARRARSAATQDVRDRRGAGALPPASGVVDGAGGR